MATVKNKYRTGKASKADKTPHHPVPRTARKTHDTSTSRHEVSHHETGGTASIKPDNESKAV
jgi:hypothetical protein